MDEDWCREALKSEYFKLQDQYESYDSRALTIKSWIGAGSIAASGLGIGQGLENLWFVLYLLTIISLCFWYLETKWKLFQYAISDRIRVIEAHFRGDKNILIKNPEPLQIYNWWFRSYVKDEPIYEYEREYRPRSRAARFREAAFQDFVHLPYSLIILFSLVALVLNWSGAFNN